MILERDEWTSTEEVLQWWKEDYKIVLEKAIEYASCAFNAKEVDDLVLIYVEGQLCIAQVKDYFEPIEIYPEVIVIDLKTKTFDSTIKKISKGIYFDK